jgi:hypothetical protein
MGRSAFAQPMSAQIDIFGIQGTGFVPPGTGVSHKPISGYPPIQVIPNLGKIGIQIA